MRFGLQVELCLWTSERFPHGMWGLCKADRSRAWGTYHPEAQRVQCCQKGHVAPRRGPLLRLGKAEEHGSSAASWKMKQQAAEGGCEDAGWWSQGEEQRASQVGVGGQHQDARQLQRESPPQLTFWALGRGGPTHGGAWRGGGGLLNALK